MSKPSTTRPQFAIYFAVCISIGLIAGKYLYQDTSSTGNNKILNILQKVDNYYVDDVNAQQLQEHTINSMLEYLDPHSYYLPAIAMQLEQEKMQGNFEGIGVQFKIIDDTICILKAIENGPSKRAGILAGDRLIKVEQKDFVGDSITNEFAMKNLKGEAGSQVKITVLRQKKELDFTINRGEIPIESIETTSVLADGIGYVKISRFANQSYDEFMEAMQKINANSLKGLIIDVRDNPGGLMNAVTAITQEFLTKDQLIVYTKGRRENEEYKSKKEGLFSTLPVCVLINENSASASEILAGAIQDNDRGIIIGRRSFGKGLVQRPFNLQDGSALRLTIARYYTPTGRCIQKNYGENNESYYEENNLRLQTGELSSSDSIPVHDSLKFYTPQGKLVYGGGGIIPDYFVPIDSTIFDSYFQQVLQENILDKYYLKSITKWVKELEGKNIEDAYNKLKKSTLSRDFTQYAFINSKDHLTTKKSNDKLIELLQAKILDCVFNNQGYYFPLLQEDKSVQKAIKQLSENRN